MTNSSFRERIERLERIPGAPRISSGSSADVQLQPPDELGQLKTIPAIEALARRGTPLRVAKVAIEAFVEHRARPQSVHVPHLGDRHEFEAEMAETGLKVRFLVPA